MKPDVIAQIRTQCMLAAQEYLIKRGRTYTIEEVIEKANILSNYCLYGR